MLRLLGFLTAGLLSVASASAFQIPASSTQCVVGTAKDWNTSHVTLKFYQRDGNAWRQIGDAWNGRLGKNGLVWGRGMSPNPPGAVLKSEGDNRAPAGVFSIGGAWGRDASIRKHPKLYYRQVTSRDLWVEDPTSPNYNRHVVLDHEPATAWEKKQQMKQANDNAHALKLFIAHNAPPRATPGGGSSIFFHIWRGGGSKPSAGCTTMPEEKLRWLIARIDPNRNPVYVLLTEADYQAKREVWNLP
jgi:L,D-peptidoglycan transpeptidase YkuD (ErfK/YbiS/YcfS/YnhG family)